VTAWALVQVDNSAAIDLYLTHEKAEEALADCLRDEPEWRDLLRIEEIELHGLPPSPN
jgi:hypothetical protein